MNKNILNLFGLGKTRFSASTASLLALPVYFFLKRYATEAIDFNFILVFALLIWSSISFVQNKTHAGQDSKEIVLDEFLGMLICLMIAGTDRVIYLFVLFVAFRVIDILKPPPFSWIDKKFKNGFGIMADDIAIGIFIGIVFLLLQRIIL